MGKRARRAGTSGNQKNTLREKRVDGWVVESDAFEKHYSKNYREFESRSTLSDVDPLGLRSTIPQGQKNKIAP